MARGRADGRGADGQEVPAEPSNGERVRDGLGVLGRVVLGGVLLVAGALKVAQPEVSARSVQAYQLLPFDVATYVGYALPIAEIIVGLLLVVGLFTRTAALVSGILMVAFIVGIASAWARGLSIDCGCFGEGGATQNPQYLPEIVRDVALAVCAGWLVVRPRTRWSADAALFRG